MCRICTLVSEHVGQKGTDVEATHVSPTHDLRICAAVQHRIVADTQNTASAFCKVNIVLDGNRIRWQPPSGGTRHKSCTLRNPSKPSSGENTRVRQYPTSRQHGRSPRNTNTSVKEKSHKASLSVLAVCWRCVPAKLMAREQPSPRVTC